MQILDLLNNGATQLRKKNISSNKLDSEILLSKVLKKNREDLLINLDNKVDQNTIQGTPLALIWVRRSETIHVHEFRNGQQRRQHLVCA